MALTTNALHALTQRPGADTWRVIVELAAGNAPSKVVRHDRDIDALDLFLLSYGWDLWHAFCDSVKSALDRLTHWGAELLSAKEALTLNGLSLRKLPWLFQGAKESGFTTLAVVALVSELPRESDEFSYAPGFTIPRKKEAQETGTFVPPVALQSNRPYGAHLLALRHRKLRSKGDYPTLMH